MLNCESGSRHCRFRSSGTSPLELPLPLPPSEMVSRRKILSRSRDDLHMDTTFQQPEDEEDVWYQRDKLYKVGPVVLLSRIIM